MTTIENEYLKVSINPAGAQLTSIYNKAAQIEQLWQANPAIWPWHAPNLFPVVGGLLNNELRVDGHTYPLGRHGFARQSDFELIEASATHAVFSLAASTQTKAGYPYEFAFQVLYDLFDKALRVSYKVINLDNQSIYFSVGAHPAFNVPFSPGENYDDYYLEFETDEALHTHMLSSGGYFTGSTLPVTLQDGKLPLYYNLFSNDALVFKNLHSRRVTIKSVHHQHSLSVAFPHFSYLGLWAKQNADFICIEPWLGCADTENEAVDIKNKEAIQKLDKGHVFEAHYSISV